MQLTHFSVNIYKISNNIKYIRFKKLLRIISQNKLIIFISFT
jgi:hypothetical protein